MDQSFTEAVRESLRVKLKTHASAAAAGATGDGDGQATKESKLLAEGAYERMNLQRQQAETEGLQQRNQDRQANRVMRTDYAKAVFRYLVCYSLFVGALLLLSGFKAWGFELPEAVLSFLVGSTAASAIGLVFAVTHGLFNGISKV